MVVREGEKIRLEKERECYQKVGEEKRKKEEEEEEGKAHEESWKLIITIFYSSSSPSPCVRGEF